MTTIGEANGVAHPKIPQWGTPIDVDGPTELADGGGLKAGDETAPEPVDRHLVAVKPKRSEREFSEIPPWATSLQVAREMLTSGMRQAGRRTAAYVLHSPEMILIATGWIIRGLLIDLGKLGKWLFDIDGHPLVGDIKASNDRVYVTMARARTQRQKFRWSVLATLAVLALVVVTATWRMQPAMTVLLGLGAIALLVRSGKPEDVKIMSPALREHVMPRLTAQNIVRALDSLGIPALSKSLKTDTASLWRSSIVAIKGGHKVWIQLPNSCVASDLVPREQNLASALGRPEDTVIVEPMPHVTPGDLTLYVLDKPQLTSDVGPGPLATAKKTSWWEAPALGVTRLGIPHRVHLKGGAWFIGGRPGAGKSSLCRIAAAHAALDPRALLVIVNLKGSPDYEALRRVCHRYLSASPESDPTVIAETIGLLRWLLQETAKRNDYLVKLVKAGKAASNEVTPELANSHDELQPMTVVLDEIHRMFDESDNPGAKATAELIGKVEKACRSAGIHLVAATQLAGVEAVPGVVPRAARVRGCMAVTDATSFRQIFGDAGPGAFAAAGINRFTPGTILLAAQDGSPIKIGTYNLGPAAMQAIGNRAFDLRTARHALTGEAVGELVEGIPEVDLAPLLRDVLKVIGEAAPEGDRTVAWLGGPDGLEAILTAHFPATYGTLADGWLNNELIRRGVRKEKFGRRRSDGEESRLRVRVGVRAVEIRRALAAIDDRQA